MGAAATLPIRSCRRTTRCARAADATRYASAGYDRRGGETGWPAESCRSIQRARGSCREKAPGRRNARREARHRLDQRLGRIEHDAVIGIELHYARLRRADMRIQRTRLFVVDD